MKKLIWLVCCTGVVSCSNPVKQKETTSREEIPEAKEVKAVEPADEPVDIESWVNDIRIEFQRIEGKRDLEKKEIVEESPFGSEEFAAWFEGDKLVKLFYRIAGDHGITKESYYFKNEALFFAYISEDVYTNEYQVHEDRIYVREGAVIRYLTKDKVSASAPDMTKVKNVNTTYNVDREALYEEVSGKARDLAKKFEVTLAQRPFNTALEMAIDRAATGYMATKDLAGSYRPVNSISIGAIRLDNFIIGYPKDFESGNMPLAVNFSDTTSKQIVNSLGQMKYESRYHVYPDKFTVTDRKITFEGSHQQLGQLKFTGVFIENQDIGLSGTLVIGEKKAKVDFYFLAPK